jgi:hypothetical protein
VWAPYHEPFKKAIELGLVNEAMDIWNEAAVKSLTELIPDANYSEYIRGGCPNIVNKPLFKKNTDDIRDKTQWHCNVIEACNLIKTLTTTKEAAMEGKQLDLATFSRIQELLITNNISIKNKYPEKPSDIKHFISFLNLQRKRHTSFVKTQRIKEWTEKMTNSRKFAFKWLKEKPQLPPIALNCGGKFCANPDENVKHMREAWSQYIEKYKNKPQLEPNDFIEFFKDEIDELKTEMHLDEIKTQDYFHKLQHRRTEAKGGLDSWRTIELQKIHIYLIDHLSTLINKCELITEWPTTLTRGLTAFIPKGQGNSPLALRPITLESVILSTWSSLRFRQATPWQELICTNDLYGGRMHLSPTDAEMPAAAYLEQALLEHIEVIG